ncbi:hypothetical protein CC80DRAFT_518989 [Byssothecium circinans]|uniref:C2H2-type domain-containing protein n=1 Tax=Byssothecium circinans TaxID=147558 RepID=A0A6A5THX0_9PLEO|nr:hypothetical protein CC80DRAFT_518989 [Byssothecium circinans]
MYSTGDNSEDEETLDATPSTLSKATLTTIELIMRKIELNLSYAAYIQCAGSHSSRAQGSASTRGSGGRPQTNNGKRKSRLDDHLPPDDPDDDGTNKRRRISITTTTEDSESGPRFACPFFKHDPNRYRNRRTCPGPGWPTVHRMKEHLYRSHAQPIFCPRCYAMFDSDNEFSNHLRGIPCQISVPQPIEGIDRETLKGLRKRSPALRLEEDKWRDTYLLLFPDVGANDIPSPYYDTDTPTEESRRFRRELLERVRQELFATAEREPGPVEQRLLRQVAGIIQRCEGELLASFYAEEGNNAHPLMPANPSPRPSGPTTQDHPVSASPRRPSFRTAPFAQGSTVPTVQTQHVEPPMSPRSVPVLQPPVQRQQEQPQQQQQQHPLDEDAEMTGGQQGQLLGVGYTDFSSDWIDWNAIFPPGVGSERAVSTPVWT